jgi:hypothetical protein
VGGAEHDAGDEAPVVAELVEDLGERRPDATGDVAGGGLLRPRDDLDYEPFGASADETIGATR